jgi:CIC family chloride channel protein
VTSPNGQEVPAGGICGLAAVAFHLSIVGLEVVLIDRANAVPGHRWIWWTIVSPTIGGLIAGIGLTYFAPAAAGSGIPQVKVAYTLRYGLVTIREAKQLGP